MTFLSRQGTGAPAARSARRGPAHGSHIRGRHGVRAGRPAGPHGVHGRSGAGAAMAPHPLAADEPGRR